jgi:type II secretory pathway pseudopilin PulG
MKTIIGLAIVIVLAAAVIIPISNARTQAELEAQRTQTALEQAQTELEALKSAQTTETLAVEPTETTQEVSQTEEVAATEVKAVETESTPEPTAKPEVKPTSSPQVEQTAKPAAVYPKYFYENGQKYAYYDEFHEKEGMKTLIADEDEPNVTSGETYDWENDPLKDVPGPFTGNGSN